MFVVVVLKEDGESELRRQAHTTTTTTAKNNNQLTEVQKQGPWRAVPLRLETNGNRDKTFIAIRAFACMDGT